MINFLRTTFTDTTEDDIKQEAYVANTQAYHGGRATQYVHNYQLDRLWKQNFLLVNIVAEGYDQQRFVRAMCKQKDTTPNVDYFTRDEIRTLVKEFKDEQNADNMSDTSSSRNSLIDGSTAKLFDEMMNRRRSNTAMKRRKTNTATETILNQNLGTTCLVNNVTQYITSTIAGYVRDQSQMITIDTFPMKWRVKRLDSDFLVLRSYLLRQFPQSIIPPLPKKKDKRLTSKQLLRRQTYYARFLNTILKSAVLKTSTFLVSFLQEQNQEAFNVKLLTVEADNGPKNIYEFKTLTGDIEVDNRRKAQKFAEGMSNFTEQYTKINNYLGKKTKDLQRRAHELADDYYGIGAEINHFQELLKETEVPQISNLYKHISDLVVRNGDLVLHQGELMNESLSCWFKYQREQSTSLKEAFWLVREANKRFDAQKAELSKNKERLFKRQNVQEWGCAPDKVNEAMASLQDAERAFTFMLPNSTRQVNYLEEEAAFFTCQVHKEVKRTTMLDYAMAREHFVDMGEQTHRHFHDVTQAWGNFLDFYSDLNKARKEKDDDYVDRHLIGEELVEPDEQNQFDNADEDLYDEYETDRVEGEREAGKNLLGDFENEIKAEESKTEEKDLEAEAASNHRGRSMSMVQKHTAGLEAETKLLDDLLPDEEGFDGMGDAEDAPANLKDGEQQDSTL